MGSASVTSKGQVTIPKRARQALGITPGTKVEFDVEGGGARLKVVKVRKPSSVKGGTVSWAIPPLESRSISERLHLGSIRK